MSSKNKVTKDPKKQATGRKAYEKYMDKLKQDILKNSDSTSSSGSNSSVNSSSSGTNSSNDSSSSGTNSSSNSSSGGTNNSSGGTNNSSGGSTITNFSYIHRVGAIAVLSLAVCIFIIPKLMTNQTTSQSDKDPKKISKIRWKML